MSSVTSEGSVQLLEEVFSGPVLAPGDPGYDEARRVHNGLIDKHPAVIARCQQTADVADAVKFGRSEGVEISVRGGGHNVAGKAVTEGGLMIDLSLMKGIHVDPVRSAARAQPGVTVGELDRATAAFGLATPSGVVSSTGIAGLTLGGGIAWLMGKHGMAVDNLLSAEVVLASGEVVTASEDTRSRSVLGAPRGRGQLRRRDLIRVPHASARQRPRRSRAASARRGAAALLVLPRLRRRPPGRALHAGRLPPCARRIGDEALRNCGLPCRRRRRPSRGRHPPAAPVRLTGNGHDPAHAVPRREHRGRLAGPDGLAQVLEVRVLLGVVGSGRRGDDQGVRAGAQRTLRARDRGLPRCGHARGPDGHRLPAQGARATTSF